MQMELPLKDTETDSIVQTFLWIVEQQDGSFAIFEEIESGGRVFLDEDFDIDELISRHKDNNIIISY